MRIIAIGMSDAINLERYAYTTFASLVDILKWHGEAMRVEVFYERRTETLFSVGATFLDDHHRRFINDKTIGSGFRYPDGIGLDSLVSFFKYRFGQMMLPMGWILKEELTPNCTQGFVLDRIQFPS